MEGDRIESCPESPEMDRIDSRSEFPEMDRIESCSESPEMDRIESCPVSSERGQDQEEMHGNILSSKTSQKKPGGWKSMPYILGNETFERLATMALTANFLVYLVKELYLEQVVAVQILNIWGGVSSFAPLLGAFISDAYLGRFKTIAFASCASLLGMVNMTLTAWVPQLHPPKCNLERQSFDQCRSANSAQLSVLFLALGLLSIGTGGIRPCSIPFGVDQFDPTNEEGRKGINSFYNWYYTTFTVLILFSKTIVVYVQDKYGWVIGFGIPTILMGCSIILFFIGTRVYVHVKPEGSLLSSIVQVLVAAYKKRNLQLPEGDVDGLFYNPPSKVSALSKLPLTNQFRFLNKAALIVENDELHPDGSPIDKWRLCSIQQVEEVKCLVKIIPIWATGIFTFISITQQSTFTVSQALKMDRHLGPKFEIPAASIGVISLLTFAIWVPVYDRIFVPALRKITNHEGGMTLLQRIGIGIIFSILSTVAAGLIEKERRASANLHPQPKGSTPMSVMWLAPQLILMGFCEAFYIIGQTEFLNKQFPDHMKGIANSLLPCSSGIASYLSSLLVTILHAKTGSHDHADWLTNDLNAGRLDYFYYLISAIGVVNFIYFMYCAHGYRYKVSEKIEDEPYPDLELVDSNH